MTKPFLGRLWNAFPDHGHYPNMEALYTWLGGAAQRNINVDGFGPNGNTCASRMSVAFNHGGAPIIATRVPSHKTIGPQTEHGSFGKWRSSAAIFSRRWEVRPSIM